MTTIYRNYDVAKVGNNYVAQSEEEDAVMVSRDFARIRLAIDLLWDGVARGAKPVWFSTNTVLDLDSVDIEATESVPSETDPPKQVKKISYTWFALSAFVVSIPLAGLLSLVKSSAETEILFTFAVCAVAVAFGRGYALLMCGLSALLYNVFIIEPSMTLTAPTAAELAYILLNILASIAIPMIMKSKGLRPDSSV